MKAIVTWSAAVAALVFSSIAAHAQAPANDNFADAQALPGAGGSVSGSNFNATAQSGEPNHFGSLSHSIWYRWTAPGSGLVEFTTAGSGFDTVLSVYSGTALNNLAVVVEDDDGGPGATSLLSFDAVAGTVYHIAVDGFSDRWGNVTLSWSLDLPGFAFSQLEFTGFESIGTALITVSRTDTLVGDVTVQYATTAGTAAAGTDYTTTTGTLAFAAGVAEVSFTVPISNDLEGEPAESLQVTLSNPSGGVMVVTPTAALVIVSDDPVANDNLANATIVTGAEGAVSGLLSRPTFEPGEQDVFGSGVGSVWYRWTAPANGVAEFDASGSEFFPQLAVFTGADLPNLALVAFNFDARISFVAVAGRTYYVAVNGFGEEGAIELTYRFSAAGALQFQTETVSVGEAPGVSATLTVERIGGSAGIVTVEVLLSDSSAEAGFDYTDASTVLTFQAGETSKTIAIPILADLDFEGDEEGYATLGEITGGALPGFPTEARFVIVDNDDDPTNDDFAAAFTLTGSDGSVSGELFGADYETGEALAFLTGTIWYRFTPQASGILELGAFINNGFSFPAATVNVFTGASIGALTQVGVDDFGSTVLPVTAGMTYHIAVDGSYSGEEGPIELFYAVAPPEPETSLVFITGSEVKENAGPAVITIERFAPLTGAASVRVTTDSGSAESPGDFTAVTMVVVFAPGERTKTVPVTLINDTEAEGNEYLVASISELVGLTLGNNADLISIQDDDDDPANNAFAAATLLQGVNGAVNGTTVGADAEVHESDNTAPSVWFRWTPGIAGLATLEAISGETSDLQVEVFRGASLRTLRSLNPGFTSREAQFMAEPGVNYMVRVSSRVFPGAFSLNFRVTPGGGMIAFQDAFVRTFEPNGTVSITLLRTGDLSATASVTCTPLADSAETPADFGPAAGRVVTFVAGESTKTVTFNLVNDPDLEGEERFFVQLSDPSAEIELAFGMVQVDIRDDEDAPANDNFGNAQVIAGPSGQVLGDNFGAGLEAGEEAILDLGEASVWYRWTAPVTGVFTFSTANSSIESLLQISTGPSVSALQTVGTSNYGSNSSSHDVSFLATAGTTYHIAIAGTFGGEGEVTLAWYFGYTLDPRRLIRFSQAEFTGSEGSGVVEVTLVRNGPADGYDEIAFETYGGGEGEATPGVDFEEVFEVVAFEAGETVKTVTIPVIADAIDELNEAISVSIYLNDGVADVESETAIARITDDDAAVLPAAKFAGVFDDVSTGAFTFKTTAKGALSGSFTLEGVKFGFSGKFDGNGVFTKQFTRKVKGGQPPLPPLTLTLQMTDDGTAAYGTISDPTGLLAAFTADAATYSKKNPAPQAGLYTVLLPAAEFAEEAPRGTGFATLKITTAGTFALAGSLADGSKISLSGAVPGDGVLPIFIPLYGKTGYLAGELAVDPLVGAVLESSFTWWKPARPKDKLFQSGFFTSLDAWAARYVPPAKDKHALVELQTSAGGAVAFVGEGNLVDDLGLLVSVSPQNKVTAAGANARKLAAKIVPKTGLISGSFLADPANAKSKRKFLGVLFQADGLGAGYFLGTSESGFMTLEPLLP